MGLKTQAKSQWSYMQLHRGKTIGAGVGLSAGVLYGLANAKGKWGVIGFTLVGLIAGGVIGGMIDASTGAGMMQTSNGDSSKSQFRGYRTGGMEINRPIPRSGRNRIKRNTKFNTRR